MSGPRPRVNGEPTRTSSVGASASSAVRWLAGGRVPELPSKRGPESVAVLLEPRGDVLEGAIGCVADRVDREPAVPVAPACIAGHTQARLRTVVPRPSAGIGEVSSRGVLEAVRHLQLDVEGPLTIVHG